MINYIIINGTNSNTINGLGINELPPISKPPLRVQTEEIDGRDGDISTNLGYGAYDKTITIGLFGTGYDINEVISFFNGEGTVVFSNEPNKYYKYKIINQIDYEALLKFKSATITFHCQPFKYPLEETPLEIEYEYIEQDGVESATLDNTSDKAPLKTKLKGNTSQKVTNNLMNLSSVAPSGTTYNIKAPTLTNGVINVQGNYNQDYNANNYRNGYVEISTLNNKINTTYYVSCKIDIVSNPRNVTQFQALLNGDGNTAQNLTYNSQTGRYQCSMTSRDTINHYYLEIRVASCELNISEISVKETEDYTFNGYGVSPTPDIPSPINVVSGDNTIKVEGKNLLNINRALGTPSDTSPANTTKRLFNYNEYVKGISVNNFYSTSFITSSSISNNTITIKNNNGAYGLGLAIKVKPNQNYKLSYLTSASSNQNTGVGYYSSDGTNLSFAVSSGTNNYLDITTPNNCDFMVIVFRPEANTEITYSNIMLEYGTTNSDYEHYTGTSYPINLPVKNFFTFGGIEDGTRNGVERTINGSKLTLSGTTEGANDTITTTDLGIELPAGDYYFNIFKDGTFTYPSGANTALIVKDVNNNAVFSGTMAALVTNGSLEGTFTLSAKTRLYIQLYSNAANQVFDCDLYCQVEKGTKKNSYTPYGVEPIELCKIGDYQDYFTKNSDGQWCKYNAIGKVVLDGSETWTSGSISDNNIVFSTTIIDGVFNVNENYRSLCNDFTYNANIWNTDNLVGFALLNVSYSLRIRLEKSRLSDTSTQANAINSFKTWLGSNNTLVYYVYATPTNTEITDSTLITQLDNIKNAISYEGQTNVSQENNDKPFLLDLIAMKDGSDEVVINNIGNTYSKPTIALEGTGTTDIYLNDTQILKVDLTDTNTITIDTNNMEAYNPTDNTLANRKVVGNYNSMTLPSGNTTMKITGALEKATISNYTRWL